MCGVVVSVARPIRTCVGLFFFNDTATTEIYTLSLHDALPIFGKAPRGMFRNVRPDDMLAHVLKGVIARVPGLDPHDIGRSEEPTSELQSPDHLVSPLLLEKQN